MKTNYPHIQINVPYAKKFNDYHDIDCHAEDINDVGFVREGHVFREAKLKAYECGFDGHYYLGLFYVGKRPSRSEIKERELSEIVAIRRRRCKILSGHGKNHESHN